jgi:hypothetical protein
MDVPCFLHEGRAKCWWTCTLAVHALGILSMRVCQSVYVVSNTPVFFSYTLVCELVSLLAGSAPQDLSIGFQTLQAWNFGVLPRCMFSWWCANLVFPVHSQRRSYLHSMDVLCYCAVRCFAAFAACNVSHCQAAGLLTCSASGIGQGCCLG